jgi:hypothetical protein
MRMRKTTLLLLNGTLVAFLTPPASATLVVYEPIANTSAFAARAKTWKPLGT